MTPDKESGSGYLTIFRELNNDSTSAEIEVEVVANRTITITNLMDDTQRTVDVGADGKVSFTIDRTPGYLFLRYE